MKTNMIYEGKAKQVFATDVLNQVIIKYKDDATAFNGVKKSTIQNKGRLNNAITTEIFIYLMDHGIPTHFIKKISEREQVCQKVSIFQVEVIIRNVIAGSMAKRLGIEEGTIPPKTIYELCYKNDSFNDPLINEDHAVALNLATEEELETMKIMAHKINHLLKAKFLKIGIELIDFKIEFGKNDLGEIVLADEISPDTCRLWDSITKEKLDKDRFRRDLGKIIEAYEEILRRLTS